MSERRIRSIVKSVTWRIEATVLTTLLVYIFTSNWKLALGLGIVDFFIKMTFYYINERIWNRIKWGLKA